MDSPLFLSTRYPSPTWASNQVTSPLAEASSSQISLAQNVQAVQSVPPLSFDLESIGLWQFQPETGDNPSDVFAKRKWSPGSSTLAQRPTPAEAPQFPSTALQGMWPSTLAQGPSQAETSSIIGTALQGEQALDMESLEPWPFQPETWEKPDDVFAGEWSTGFSTLAQHSSPPETSSINGTALQAPFQLETWDNAHDVYAGEWSTGFSTLAQHSSPPETSSINGTALQAPFQLETWDNAHDVCAEEWPIGFSTSAQHSSPPETSSINGTALQAPFQLETWDNAHDVRAEEWPIGFSTSAQHPSPPETSSIIGTALQGEQPVEMRKRSAGNATDAVFMPPSVKRTKSFVSADLLQRVKDNPRIIHDAKSFKRFAAEACVREATLRYFVQVDGSLRKPGRDRIAEAEGWVFADVDIDLIQKVKANPGLVEAAGGLEGFAEQENLRYSDLQRYVTAWGELKGAANDLIRKKDGLPFVTVDIDLLRKVAANPQLISDAGGVGGFAEKNDYFYSTLNRYFKEDGRLKPPAKRRLREADG